MSLDVSAVPERPAGAGRYTIELARALDQLPEVETTLLARKDDADRWATVAPRSGVTARIPNSRPVRLFYEQTALGHDIRRLGVSVHHGPHYTMPLKMATPAVVTIHDVTFFERPEVHERTKVLYFRKVIELAATRAAVLVCVSERTARRLRDHVDVAAPVVVARHGIDHRRFRPEESATGEDAAQLGSLGLELGRPRIVTLGTLEPRKGITTLLGALEALSGERPDLELVVAGQRGWGMDLIDAALDASPVGDRVRLLGYVPDEVVPALLRTASVVAYPSIDEGFGLPALEALACGAPVVTTAGSVMAELCGDAPWLFPAGDEGGLATMISDALDAGPAEVRRRRALGLETAAQFTWAETARRHIEAYRIAAGEPGSVHGEG